MIPFDFHLRTRIVFGSGSISRLGELAGELGSRRALVVSDSGVVTAGLVARGLEILKQAGIEPFLFQDLQSNPTTEDVDRGLKVAKRYEPELIIGLGGGSSMDCAKGINFLYSNGGQIKDYWGVGKALQPMLPMIAVPTTAGTGSETQSFALISDAKTHTKMACGDKKASFRVAVLDPELTLTQPANVTALTGIDAISHAIESYVTRRRNEISLICSREAWRRLCVSFEQVLEQPSDLGARGEMQLGACFAGLAIENSMLGAAHALANPLTSQHDVTHGQAVAVMLPHIVRFNGDKFAAWYGELFDEWQSVVGNAPAAISDQEKVVRLADYLANLVDRAGLKRKLNQLGVTQAHLPALADEASKQWTASFNPREVQREDLLALYAAALL